MNTRHTRGVSMIKRSPRPGERRGFALIAVLWLIVAMAALGLDDYATARDSLATAQNRINATSARWRASGCAEAVRAAVDMALGDTLTSPVAAWDTVDMVLAAPGAVPAGCSVVAAAAGDRLDANSAQIDGLRATFVAAGADQARADSLADALVDWRDADSVPHALGAEGEWYRSSGRVTPSNRPFESTEEIRLVRGFESADSVIALLTVEPGRILLDRAPLPVIAALPGMTPETVGRIAELRWRHEPVGDLARLGGLLSDDARRTLNAAYPALVRQVTSEPDAWIVRITASAGVPQSSETDELRLVRAGRRAGVTRERIWP